MHFLDMILTTNLIIFDAAQALDYSYSQEEQEANARPAQDQHPRHVWLCGAVGVGVPRGNRLEKESY